MSRLSEHARRSLKTLHEFAARRVIKQFASKYHFVYFGYVDSRGDEHELIRGVTVSVHHTDNHYTVGTFQGRDITFVMRRNRLKFPDRPSSDYTWLIMQFDLKRDNLPHLFLDAHHHDATFYANFALVHTHLQNISGVFAQSDPVFAQAFKIFGNPDDLLEIKELLPSGIMNSLARFRDFDYEMNEDYLLVYASNPLPALALLNDMLRVGQWLADALDGEPTKKAA